MSEEPQKKTGVILEKRPDQTDENGVFLQKSLKYVLTPEKRKQDTKDRQEDFLIIYRRNSGGDYMSAYIQANIPRQTFWDWFHKDAEFEKKVLEIRRNNINVMEDVLVAKAKSGNVSAVRFWLESNHPTYNKRIKIETFTGDRTLEDLMDEDEEKLNKNNDNAKENKKDEPRADREVVEDKKQAEENSQVSA